MSKVYAVIPKKSKQVENTILAEDGFTVAGYKVIELSDDIYCQPGMYWNEEDGLFYQDEEFKEVYPPPPPEDTI
jgi:hypothetical protein